jgi:hypothetical protein
MNGHQSVPVDELLEAKVDALRSYRRLSLFAGGQIASGYTDDQGERHSVTGTQKVPAHVREEQVREYSRALREASDFYWSTEIINAVTASAESLPDDTTITEQLLPFNHNLWLWFEYPVHVPFMDPEDIADGGQGGGYDMKAAHLLIEEESEGKRSRRSTTSF